MKTHTTILYCGPEDALFKKLSRASRDLVWEARQPKFNRSPQKLAQDAKASVLLLRIKKEFELKHQEWLSRNDSSIPFIVIAQNDTLEIAIQSVQYGAYDYFCVNRSVDVILRKIREALLMKSTKVTRRHLEGVNHILLGNDPAIENINRQAEQLACDRKPLLLVGEPGTGKEHLAFGLYRHSGDKSPFARYDCRILDEMSKYDGQAVPQLIHARIQQIKKTSGSGFLFLSHAERLDSDQLQSAMERGSSSVRLIASYEHSRPPQLDDKTLRAIPLLKIPALRERKDDIPLIAEFFVRRVAQKRKLRSKAICDDTLLLMQEYTWPGNIQELSNVIDRMMLLEPSEVLRAATWHLAHGCNVSVNLDGYNQFSMLLEDMLRSAEAHWRKGKLYADFVEKMEKMLIELVLPQVDHNQATAAKILGISRNTLRERLKSSI